MNYVPVIVRVALKSRVIVLCIQYFSNILIPDHKADAFLYPGYTETKGDDFVFHFLGGLLRWDAQYFLHIAKYGYTFENMLAFFPLYPFLVRIVGGLMSTVLITFINVDSILLLSACLINIILFCLTALCLFKLTLIFFTEDFAYKTVILFCLNPASIFFTAPYTECLFCYLTLKSMLNCVILYQKYSVNLGNFYWKDILYLTPIALSTVTRSNGLLNIGFFMYTIICLSLRNLKHINMKNLKCIIKYVLIVGIAVIFCLIPFIGFQVYAYRKFCNDFIYAPDVNIQEYAKTHDVILQGQYSTHKQLWCRSRVPLSYSYIQSKYWNVGFLKYYESKQIPNFLLACPVLLIVLCYSVRYLHRNFKPTLSSIFTFDTNLSDENINIYHPIVFVYVIHASFLTVFSVFFIHIQVSTRMILSASPVVYWYCAYHFLGVKLKMVSLEMFRQKSRNGHQKLIKIYFVMYTVIGTIMFSNFLPWT